VAPAVAGWHTFRQPKGDRVRVLLYLTGALLLLISVGLCVVAHRAVGPPDGGFEVTGYVVARGDDLDVVTLADLDSTRSDPSAMVSLIYAQKTRDGFPPVSREVKWQWQLNTIGGTPETVNNQIARELPQIHKKVLLLAPYPLSADESLFLGAASGTAVRTTGTCFAIDGAIVAFLGMAVIAMPLLVRYTRA
jgi:hypothetical protein